MMRHLMMINEYVHSEMMWFIVDWLSHSANLHPYIKWTQNGYIFNELNLYCFYLLPLKSSNLLFMYQSTDGSGIPRGGVQFSTTGPPTIATVSFGTRRKSSRNTETQCKTKTCYFMKFYLEMEKTNCHIK